MHIDQTIRLFDCYDHKGASLLNGMVTTTGIVCIQQGVEETPDDEEEMSPPNT